MSYDNAFKKKPAFYEGGLVWRDQPINDLNQSIVQSFIKNFKTAID